MKKKLIPLSLFMILPLAGQDLKMLEAEAVKKWPTRPEMQEHQIKEETEAFHKLADIQADEVMNEAALTFFRKWAAEKWPSSYSMQLFSLKKEIEAGHKLARFAWPSEMDQGTREVIKKAADEKWTRWSMSLYQMEKQAKAWRQVQRFKARGKEAREAVAAAAQKWPHDFAMQLFAVENPRE